MRSEATMPDKDIHLIPSPADHEAPKNPEEFEKLEEQKKAERVADEAVEQSGETERGTTETMIYSQSS
jgi:hypothetical protein